MSNKLMILVILKMMKILFICFNLLVLLNRKQTTIEIHQQIGWDISNKWPIKPQHIISDYGKTTSHERVNRRRRIKRIITKLDIKENIDSLQIKDIRLVAIISSAKNTDTLLIDYKGYCKFKDKKFLLDESLAIALNVKGTRFNPKYRVKGKYKGKGNFDDWE